jgi:hypothetical protein
MSIQHANRGIVKKDLQLYYNREFQKSFRGEATSNLIMNPSDANYYQGLYNFTVTPNAAVAPDGSNNAWSLAWNGTDFNYYSKNFPIVNSTVYTTSVFAKAGTHDVIWIGIGNMSGGENNASFNLTTGVATNGSPASTSCSMVYYGGGWWRCIMTNTSGTSGATTSAMTVSIGSGRASLGTVYFWGFQAERKAYVSTFLDSLNPIRNQVATNLYSADPYDGLDFVTVYNYQGSTGASFYAVVGIDNPINAPNVLQYNTGTTGYQYFALTKTGLASGTYTVSYYARLASGGPSALNNAQLWRDNVSDRAMDGDPNPTIYTYWRRFRVTALVTSGTLHFFPIHNNPITGGFTVYFTGFQLESGNEPTSFTPSSVSTANTIASNGGLLDISGNNVNANLTNVLFNGNGYYFNGSSNSIYLGTELNLQNGTICAWVNPAISSATTYHGIIGKTSGGGGGQQTWYIDWISGNALRGGIGDSSGADTVTQTWNPTIGTWYFITFVFDNSYLYLYINGVSFVTPTARTRICQNSAHPVYIGRVFEQASYAWNGQIGQVTVNRTALSAAEVIQNFTATRKTYGI